MAPGVLAPGELLHPVQQLGGHEAFLSLDASGRYS